MRESIPTSVPNISRVTLLSCIAQGVIEDPEGKLKKELTKVIYPNPRPDGYLSPEDYRIFQKKESERIQVIIEAAKN